MYNDTIVISFKLMLIAEAYGLCGLLCKKIQVWNSSHGIFTAMTYNDENGRHTM